MSSTDKAKALLAAAEHEDTDECPPSCQPCQRAEDAILAMMDKGHIYLRGYLGAVEALERQRALLVNLMTNPPEAIDEGQIRYIVGDKALADWEELWA